MVLDQHSILHFIICLFACNIEYLSQDLSASSTEEAEYSTNDMDSLCQVGTQGKISVFDWSVITAVLSAVLSKTSLTGKTGLELTSGR